MPADLLDAFRAITDPLCRRGVRHQLVLVLGIAACAVLAGARSYVAIGEWAHDLPESVRRRLGIERVPPSETSIRRMLQAIDPHLLDRTVSGWLAARAAPTPQRWRAVAVDGKTARGARQWGGRAVHLLGALDHADGVVLGQRVVEGKSNEITAFAPLLDGIDLTDVIVTADALHTQREHAEYICGRGGHYLFIVKGNQPTLHAQLKSLPWRDIPAADVTRGNGHGQVESRTVKTTAVSTGIGFPHARLAIQITRRRRPLKAKKWHTETVYAITDLDQTQIRPDDIAETIRGHWHIENRLHWVRDVTFADYSASGIMPTWLWDPGAVTGKARWLVGIISRVVSGRRWPGGSPDPPGGGDEDDARWRTWSAGEVHPGLSALPRGSWVCADGDPVPDFAVGFAAALAGS